MFGTNPMIESYNSKIIVRFKTQTHFLLLQETRLPTA
jgi:hypothetical protein